MHLSTEALKRCWFLAGPTACGKSEAGVELALRIGAEIVSMDSMSIYCGMDIGTAKPSTRLRTLVPHHLIDIADPHEDYSVADYLAAAKRIVGEIVERGRIPLFVGGTGLYLRSLLRGLFEGPPADPELRQSLTAELTELSPAEITARLRRVDPEAADAIHPGDIRRTVRALEVHSLTGVPLSQFQRQVPHPAEARPRNVYWLSPPRQWLHDRIDRRVEQMFAAGFVEEVRGLIRAGRPLGRTASQALGYKEVIEFLETAELKQGSPLSETITAIQTRTRQFAKRQHTWFRHLEECRPVPISGDESPSQLAEQLLAEQ